LWHKEIEFCQLKKSTQSSQRKFDCDFTLTAVAVGCVGVRATVEGAARSGDVLVTSTAARAQNQNCQQHQQHQHQASDGHCQGKGALRDAQAVGVIRRLETQILLIYCSTTIFFKL